MYLYNRRAYMSNELEKNTKQNISQANNNSDVKNLERSENENIKLLLDSVNEIKKSVKKLEESLVDITAKLVNCENYFDYESTSKNIQSQNKYTNNEVFPQQKPASFNKPSYQTEVESNTPIMPGTGFASITADYLKNLNRNK